MKTTHKKCIKYNYIIPLMCSNVSLSAFENQYQKCFLSSETDERPFNN